MYSCIFVFFSSNFMHPLELDQFLSFTRFVSMVGGITSLAAGISVLSVVEIFFNFVMSRKPIDNRIHVNAQFDQENRRHQIFSQLNKVFAAFLKSTSIHGLRCITMQNRFAKIFWIIQVSLSATFCTFLVFETLKSSEKLAVITSIDHQMMSVDEVPFPSLVICPDINFDIIKADRECLIYKVCPDIPRDEM